MKNPLACTPKCRFMGSSYKVIAPHSRLSNHQTYHQFLIVPDLNNDGCLTYNDFLWAKDKICGMSGWKIDSYKYKVGQKSLT